MALLELKDERALAFEGRAILQELLGDGVAAPGVHDGAPGNVAAQIGQGTKNYSDEKNGENSDRTSAPAFFAFTENKRKKEEKEDGDDRADQERGCLHFRREER